MEWNATSVAAALVEPAPVNVALGVRVLMVDSGRASVTLPANAPAGDADAADETVSAAAMTAIAQAAGQAAIISLADEAAQVHHARAVVTIVELSMLAPARGKLTASCQIAADDIDDVRLVYSGAEETVSVSTNVSVVDASGWQVSTARIDWLVELRDVAPPTNVSSIRRPRPNRWLSLVGR